MMILGVPIGELLWLVLVILIGGVVAGILAGLFGIGGGAIVVPVLFEVFRLIGVPDAVLMQLCVGTSLAIMAPTNLRSYLAHRATGAVLSDVLRQWAPLAVVGSVVGAGIATVAPGPVFKLAFVVVAGVIAVKLLFGRDSWRIANDLPQHPLVTGVGLLIGLAAALTGVSGGSVSTMVLTLYGKPIHNAVATSAGIIVPVTIAGTFGYMLAGLPHQAVLPPLSLGFVSLIGFALMAPVSSWTAPYGARLAHALSKRHLEIAFGLFLLAAAGRFLMSLGAETPVSLSRISAHHQLVATHFPAFEPVEKAHAEEVRSQLSALRDERGNRPFHDPADRDAVERDRRGARAPVGGLDCDCVSEHLDREPDGTGGVLRQDDGAGAGIEHHIDTGAVRSEERRVGKEWSAVRS